MKKDIKENYEIEEKLRESAIIVKNRLNYKYIDNKEQIDIKK